MANLIELKDNISQKAGNLLVGDPITPLETRVADLETAALGGDSLSQQALDDIAALQSSAPIWSSLSLQLHNATGTSREYRVDNASLQEGVYRVRFSGNGVSGEVVLAVTDATQARTEVPLSPYGHVKVSEYSGGTHYPGYLFFYISHDAQRSIDSVDYRALPA